MDSEKVPRSNEFGDPKNFQESISFDGRSTVGDFIKECFQIDLTEELFIGKYLFLDQIESGGQSQVIKALDQKLNRTVAIKLYHSGLDPRQIERIMSEGRALAQVSSQFVVNCNQFDLMPNGAPYLELEWVTGQTLDKYLAETKLSMDGRRELFRKIALGVQALHSKGLLHADLKPNNVIITEEGEPKIIDLGLAQDLENETGEIGGTYPFMAPEVARKEREKIGVATDVFGLGGILYYLLTESPVYAGDSKSDTMLMAESCEIIPPREINPKSPRDLCELCNDCLNESTESRIPNVEKILKRLETNEHGFWSRVAISTACLAIVAFCCWSFFPKTEPVVKRIPTELELKIDKLFGQLSETSDIADFTEFSDLCVQNKDLEKAISILGKYEEIDEAIQIRKQELEELRKLSSEDISKLAFAIECHRKCAAELAEAHLSGVVEIYTDAADSGRNAESKFRTLRINYTDSKPGFLNRYHYKTLGLLLVAKSAASQSDGLLDIAQKKLELAKGIFGASSVEMGDSHGALGVTLLNRNQLDESIEELETAVYGGFSKSVSNSYRAALAEAFIKANRFSDTLTLLAHILEMPKPQPGEEVHIGNERIQIAEALAATGRIKESLKQLDYSILNFDYHIKHPSEETPLGLSKVRRGVAFGRQSEMLSKRNHEEAIEKAKHMVTSVDRPSDKFLGLSYLAEAYVKAAESGQFDTLELLGLAKDTNVSIRHILDDSEATLESRRLDSLKADLWVRSARVDRAFANFYEKRAPNDGAGLLENQDIVRRYLRKASEKYEDGIELLRAPKEPDWKTQRHLANAHMCLGELYERRIEYESSGETLADKAEKCLSKAEEWYQKLLGADNDLSENKSALARIAAEKQRIKVAREKLKKWESEAQLTDANE